MTSGEEAAFNRAVNEKVFGYKYIKPKHGNCCTCQTCGQDHDECICKYYNENADDDYQVLKHVHDNWCFVMTEIQFPNHGKQSMFELFQEEVVEIWDDRCDEKSHFLYGRAIGIMYEPGDYSKAALKVWEMIEEKNN